MSYKIVRFYRDDKMERNRMADNWGESLCELFGLSQPHNGMTIKEGLTLEEAQEHCNDSETSSRTCMDDKHEQQYGPWFDGYREE